MADLADRDRTEPTRIIGADLVTGAETDFMGVTATGDAQVVDKANISAVYNEINVGITPVALRVGVTNLDDRKFAHAFPKDRDIFWGYNSSVTTTTGTKIFKNTLATFKVGPDIDIFLVTTSNNSKTNIGELS